ncbi:Type IV secretion-system, TraD, DNA-binding domain protein [Thiomonas sp. CB3]|nr:Type IV secretion-system, TraD, DNA-binding domain protein [Thiomonas sp. CB3]
MGLFSKPDSLHQKQIAANAPPPKPAPASVDDGRIQIGGIKIPRRLENRGFIFSGAPGVGKSVAVTNIMDTLTSRDGADFGLVSDRSGIYTSRYFQPARDAILNPLDARAEPWSLLAELQDEHSALVLARAIVPDGEGSGAEWNAYAQSFMQAILSYSWSRNLKNRDILQLSIFSTLEELDEVLAGSPAYGLIAPGAEKMFASVRAIVSSHMMPFARLDPGAGRDSFSIRAWVNQRDTRGRGWLFWNYTTAQMYPLRPLIAAQVDIFCEALMTLAPDDNRRGWLVLDEFSSIGKVSNIENFVTNARKHGGCSILGMQSIAQINHLYSEMPARSILSSIGSSLILRTSDAQTADYLSQQIGDHQISRWVSSSSRGISDGPTGCGSSTNESQSEQIAIERVYLPVQLMKMPDLHAVLNLAGDVPVAEVDLPIPGHRQPVADPFVKREAPQPVLSPPKPPAPPPEPVAAPALDALDDLL